MMKICKHCGYVGVYHCGCLDNRVEEVYQSNECEGEMTLYDYTCKLHDAVDRERKWRPRMHESFMASLYWKRATHDVEELLKEGSTFLEFIEERATEERYSRL